MKRILHNKNWDRNAVQLQIHPPPIPIIKSKNYEIKEKYCVKIKLRKDRMSKKTKLYEL